MRKGATQSRVETFQEFFTEELQDLLSAELQIVEALPKMVKAATDGKLKQALKDHLVETKNQVNRLKKVFNILNETPSSKNCAGMEGILEEGDEVLSEKFTDAVRDIAIIGAAQKVEHYEIGAYGTAIAHAKILGYEEVAVLLKESLDEEFNADKLLTKIAEGTFFSTGLNKLGVEQTNTKKR